MELEEVVIVFMACGHVTFPIVLLHYKATFAEIETEAVFTFIHGLISTYV